VTFPNEIIQKDAQIDKVRSLLDKNYRKDHPDAVIDVYKRNKYSIRIRIIDPSFAGKDDVAREEEVLSILKKLPNETFTNITMLLLLTPGETRDSFGNVDFEHPQSSRL
jgi:stress-induced morphogen